MIAEAEATKAVPDNLKRLFKRIVEGANFVLPREATPAESEAWRLAHRTPAQVERERRTADDAAHQAQMKTRLAALKAEFDAHVTAIQQRLDAGEINLPTWRGLMLVEIRHSVLTGAVIGAGGIGNLKPEDIARVDRTVKEQAAYLDRWMIQLEKHPEQKQSAGYMANRAKLYGHAATTVADEVLDENRFQSFPSLPFHAKQWTLCRNACACGWQWVNVDYEKGNADVYWRLDWTRVPLEHCPTCLRRAEDFSPLRIRNWQFENMPSDLSPYIDR